MVGGVTNRQQMARESMHGQGRQGGLRRKEGTTMDHVRAGPLFLMALPMHVVYVYHYTEGKR